MNAMVDVSEQAEVSAVSVFRVAMENISAIWPQIEPLIAIELAGVPTHEPEDVRRILLANRANLWVQWTDAVDAMAITDFVSYPRGVALRAWLGAVKKGAKFERARFYTEMERWARRNECRWIEGCGRVGWLKVFPETRYAGMFMRVDVDKDYSQ